MADSRIEAFAERIRQSPEPLSAAMICKEALILYCEERATPTERTDPARPSVSRTLRPGQYGVSIAISRDERAWTIMKFSDRIIRPAMSELATQVPVDAVPYVSYVPLELPQGLPQSDVAQEQYSGVSMRAIIDEVPVQESDEYPDYLVYRNPRFYDINTEEIGERDVVLVLCFDVRVANA